MEKSTCLITCAKEKNGRHKWELSSAWWYNVHPESLSRLDQHTQSENDVNKCFDKKSKHWKVGRFEGKMFESWADWKGDPQEIQITNWGATSKEIVCSLFF